MKEPFKAEFIESALQKLDKREYFDELIDATSHMGIYLTALKRSIAEESCTRSMLWKENFHSTSMEGTCTSLEESLENKATNETSSSNKDLDNYTNALNSGLSYLIRDGRFSEEMLLEMHRILLSGNVHKTSENTGRYRVKQNYIKDEATKDVSFTPPAPSNVKKLMDNLISYMNNSSPTQRNLVNAALIHAQFETIHPFEDGNGRIGRMIIVLYLFFTHEIDRLYLFLSEAIEKEKYRYYKLLNDIRSNGAWNEWVKFFLDIVNKQSIKYSENIVKIEKLYTRSIQVIDEKCSSKIAKQVFECFFKMPIHTSKSIAKETGLSNTAINRALDKLVEFNLVFSNHQKRNTLYVFYELIDLI